MAESGCLRSESMNTMDVEQIIIAETLKGDQLTYTHTSIIDETVTPAPDRGYIEKNETEALPADGDNVVISVPWPENSYVKTVTLMLVDTSEADPGADTLVATNNAAAFWVRLDADNHTGTDANIMPFKRIAYENEDSGDDATLFKDSPITIIKNFTGIREEFASQVPGIKTLDDVKNDSFTILDAWNASNGKAWTDGTTNGYPLYNPSGSHKKTNFEITFKKAGKVSSASDAAIKFTTIPTVGGFLSQKISVMAICTFFKIDMEDFGF